MILRFCFGLNLRTFFSKSILDKKVGIQTTSDQINNQNLDKLGNKIILQNQLLDKLFKQNDYKEGRKIQAKMDINFNHSQLTPILASVQYQPKNMALYYGCTAGSLSYILYELTTSLSYLSIGTASLFFAYNFYHTAAILLVSKTKHISSINLNNNNQLLQINYLSSTKNIQQMMEIQQSKFTYNVMLKDPIRRHLYSLSSGILCDCNGQIMWVNQSNLQVNNHLMNILMR